MRQRYDRRHITDYRTLSGVHMPTFTTIMPVLRAGSLHRIGDEVEIVWPLETMDCGVAWPCGPPMWMKNFNP
jgi:hypothetical protein